MSSLHEITDPLFEPTVGLIGGIGMAGSGVAAILAACFALFVLVMPRGDKKMKEISNAIAKGAMAFMFLEYLSLIGFVLILFVLIAAAVSWQTGICFLVGSICSALAGAIGMLIATQANARTTAAARWSMLVALRIAFSGGAVLGLSIVVSLFARVGGGIFTKAADVGADLVGKVESGLPEDDIRNPATIADNVGDNVGDVAGMSADLCGSYVGSMIASCVLGHQLYGIRGAGFVIWMGVFGVVSSFIGHMSVWCRNNAGHFEVLLGLRAGLIISNLVQIGFLALITHLYSMPWKYFGVTCIGVVCGSLIAVGSEIFTSPKYYFTRSISAAGRLGPASVVIQGLAVGMYSLVSPAVLCAGALIACIQWAGVFGAAIGSTALLSNLAFTLTMDAMGAISDNAGGIAEMAELPEHVRNRTDTLDSIGNTTAATGKGFAIGAALLTGFTLINIFKNAIGTPLSVWDAATDGYAVSGLLIGAALPYFFSAMTMQAVASCAESVILEVRRQLRVRPGILTGESKADHARCVMNITAASIHAMIGPSFIVVMVPITVGILFPPQFLLALLLANTMSGFCLSTMMSNAGGAFDNAKKYVEAGNYGGKHSETHKATVCGDTIGDPLKDTSGPSINISIKLSNYMGVVLAPFFAKRASFWWSGFIIFTLAVAFIVPVIIASPTRMWKLFQKITGRGKGDVEDDGHDDADKKGDVDIELTESPAVYDFSKDETLKDSEIEIHTQSVTVIPKVDEDADDNLVDQDEEEQLNELQNQENDNDEEDADRYG